MIAYSDNLSTDNRNLIEQYQSAKWGIALDKLAGAGTELAEATAHNAGDPSDTASNGYNVLTTRYLERLAESADVHLQAASGVTLDLDGDTLDFTGIGKAGKSLTIQTDNGDITDISAGTIRTTRTGAGVGNEGNISFIAGGAGNINLDTTNLEALNGGEVRLSAGGDIDLVQTSALNLGQVSATNVNIRTTGGTSDITLNNTVTASDSGNALIIVSARNFINNHGAGALNASHASGRFLVYSADPGADIRGAQAFDFKRYNRSYAGYAPGSVTQTGNGFLYSIAPALTVTANDASREYGEINPAFTYGLSGFIDDDTAATSGAVTGTPAFTSAGISDDVGDYAITPALGTLASDLGYQFTTFNDGTLEITPAMLEVFAQDLSFTAGAPLPVVYNYSGFKNGETIASAGINGMPALSSLGSLNSLSAGTYTLDVDVSGLSAANYTFIAGAPAGRLGVIAAPQSNTILPSTVQQLISIPMQQLSLQNPATIQTSALSRGTENNNHSPRNIDINMSAGASSELRAQNLIGPEIVQIEKPVIDFYDLCSYNIKYCQ